MSVSFVHAQYFILVLTRVMMILIQIPLFGSDMVLDRIKIIFGFILSLVITTWQPLQPSVEELPMLVFAFSILQQLIIGFLAGFAATLTFGALQVAARMIELTSGFSSGELFNPALGMSGSAISQFFTILAMLFFLITNGHHMFLLGLQKTFEVLPVFSELPQLDPSALLHMTAQFISSGLQMAMPVMGALLMTDLALGLLAKVAPQMNVFFLGLPVKVFMGIIGVALTFSVLLPTLQGLFSNLGKRMIEILGV